MYFLGMNIQYIPTNALIPAEYNPRKISSTELKRIRESFEEFGVVQPAVVNSHKGRENIIIGGHQRIQVAREKGMTEYPCFVVDLPLDKEKKLNIKLNKIQGEWDIEKLYHNFDLDSLIDSGFSKFDLDLKFSKITMQQERELEEFSDNVGDLVDLSDAGKKKKPSEPVGSAVGDDDEGDDAGNGVMLGDPTRQKPQMSGPKFVPLSIVLEAEEHTRWLDLKKELACTSDKALLLKLMMDSTRLRQH